MPSVTSASRKSRALRGCRPSLALRVAASWRGDFASSLNTPSSTALSNVLGPQKPKPSCRIRSGVSSFDMPGASLSSVRTLALSYKDSMAEHGEVLIIGGGVIGLTTAYFLARDGARVTIVDQ